MYLPLDGIPVACKALNEGIEKLCMCCVCETKGLLKGKEPWAKLLDELGAGKENRHVLFVISSSPWVCKRRPELTGR